MLTRREALRKAGLAGSLVAIPGVAGTVVVNRAEAAVCAVPVDDPVFAAIEAHQKAWQHACDIRGSREVVQAACDAEFALLRAFMDTRPTTVPGLVAYLDHIDTEAGFQDICFEHHDAVAIIAAVRSAISGGLR